ncbi:hypothetical protein SOVF_117590 [Spinacia oleracea]|nr:hypothetical protein SOVF_117590 [Spinacia oleracea]
MDLNYCHKLVTGSYTKVKSHLLGLSGNGVEGCKTISDQVKAQLQREHDKAENLNARKAMDTKRKLEYATLPPGSDLKQQKKSKNTLEVCFNAAGRYELDKECARMFYAFALPFSLVKNPYFRQFVSKLANSKCVGRAEALVYVHTNLRMIFKKKEEYKTGPSSYWDVGGDDLLVDNEYNEAFENLFLDDPDIEATFFNDEEEV